MVSVTVVEPALIGEWCNGGQTLADQSGYNPGNQDGVASAGTGIGTATAVYNTDVPPLYAAVNNVTPGSYYCLTNNGTYAVTINGSSARGSSAYYPTFDDDINNGFSCAFWAKGVPGTYNAWVSKNGQNNNIPGWMFRQSTSDNIPSFTVRYAAGGQNNSDNPDMYNSVTVMNAPGYATNWHHYVGTYDGIAGLCKIYVDGRLSATLPNDYGPIASPIDSYLVIGGQDNADVDNATAPTVANYFTGEIFDVRMYNYPLAVSEVQSIYSNNPVAGNNTNLVVAADTPVIDLTNMGVVSISLPLGANASNAVTISVSNSNPNAVSIAGAPGNPFSYTFAVGAYPTLRLALNGLANGPATISASGAGLGSAQAAVDCYGPQLVARWFVGLSNQFDYSGFMPAHTHDAAAVMGAASGDTLVAGGALFTGAGATPAGFPGASLSLNAAYSVVISNSDAASDMLAGGSGGVPTLDPGYQSTFDDVIANRFTIAFWENCPAAPSQGNWATFVSKGGDDNMGFQVRKNGSGNNNTDDYNMHYSGSHVNDITTTPSQLFANTWTHVAIVHDGFAGYRAIYINGVLEMEQTADFGPWSQAKNHHLIIGSEEQPSGASYVLYPDDEDNSYLKGSIYDFRVYNYALASSQISQLMTYASPTLSAKPVSGGKVQLSWSSLYPGYAVETNSVLTSNGSGWAINPNLTPPLTGALENGQFVVTDTLGAGPAYYRLVFVPQ
jgi:hypothetical protein